MPASNFTCVEKWIYTQGSNGLTSITLSELIGKEIKGRIYRSGIEFRPSETPTNKEFSYNIGLGQIVFAIPFDGPENLDIPYESD